MTQRKHRFYIDVTFSSPLKPRKAARGLQMTLDKLDLNAAPVWLSAYSPYIDKIRIVERKLPMSTANRRSAARKMKLRYGSKGKVMAKPEAKPAKGKK